MCVMIFQCVGGECMCVMIFQCVGGECVYVCDDISVCRRRGCVCHDLNCSFFYTRHRRLIMNILL